LIEELSCYHSGWCKLIMTFPLIIDFFLTISVYRKPDTDTQAYILYNLTTNKQNITLSNDTQCFYFINWYIDGLVYGVWWHF
jgi:hypothetical protein